METEFTTISLYAPVDFRDKLKKLADRERRSLSAQVMIMLESELSRITLHDQPHPTPAVMQGSA